MRTVHLLPTANDLLQSNGTTLDGEFCDCLNDRFFSLILTGGGVSTTNFIDAQAGRV